MLYMPVNSLKPGMMLAKDLPSDKFHIALLKTGIIDMIKDNAELPENLF